MTMRPIRDFQEYKLTWVQPKAFKRYYELRDRREVYATLLWVKAFRSFAEATTAERKVTMKRGGFLHPHIRVTRADFGDDFATLRMRFAGGGSVEFADGRRFEFRVLSMWKNTWGVVDESERILATITMKGFAISHLRADVVIQHKGKPDWDLALLLAIAWYAIVLRNQEASRIPA